MDESMWERYGATAGILFVVLLVGTIPFGLAARDGFRATGVGYVSWYPWKQPGRYEDYLANHAGDLPVTLASACGS